MDGECSVGDSLCDEFSAFAVKPCEFLLNVSLNESFSTLLMSTETHCITITNDYEDCSACLLSHWVFNNVNNAITAMVNDTTVVVKSEASINSKQLQQKIFLEIGLTVEIQVRSEGYEEYVTNDMFLGSLLKWLLIQKNWQLLKLDVDSLELITPMINAQNTTSSRINIDALSILNITCCESSACKRNTMTCLKCNVRIQYQRLRLLPLSANGSMGMEDETLSGHFLCTGESMTVIPSGTTSTDKASVKPMMGSILSKKGTNQSLHPQPQPRPKTGSCTLVATSASSMTAVDQYLTSWDRQNRAKGYCGYLPDSPERWGSYWRWAYGCHASDSIGNSDSDSIGQVPATAVSASLPPQIGQEPPITGTVLIQTASGERRYVPSSAVCRSIVELPSESKQKANCSQLQMQLLKTLHECTQFQDIRIVEMAKAPRFQSAKQLLKPAGAIGDTQITIRSHTSANNLYPKSNSIPTTIDTPKLKTMSQNSTTFLDQQPRVPQLGKPGSNETMNKLPTTAHSTQPIATVEPKLSNAKKRKNNPNQIMSKADVVDLAKYADQRVRVRFQGGREVDGLLKGFDKLDNLVLDDCIEYIRDAEDPNKLTDITRRLGLVVCRGTQVSLLCPVDGMEEISNPFEEEGDEVEPASEA